MERAEGYSREQFFARERSRQEMRGEPVQLSRSGEALP